MAALGTILFILVLIAGVIILTIFPIFLWESGSELVRTVRRRNDGEQGKWLLRVDPGPVIGMAAAVAFGIAARIVYGSNLNPSGPLTVSFFVFVPIVIGFLTIVLASPARRASRRYVLLAPWIPCSLCMLIATLLLHEAWFCVLLALPLIVLSSSIGGGLAVAVWQLARGSHRPSILALVMFTGLPYASMPVANQRPVETWTPVVHSQIEIEAPPDIVWRHISNLEPVQPSERRFAIFHLMGFPRPIEARMTCEEVGCTRRGQWENGLAFEGTITQIEPGRSFWLRLEADTRDVTPSLVPLHQIGGRTFGMIDDGYEIEDLGHGRSRLHLYGTYRIRSGINGYAQAWLDFLMQDMQRYILGVEKERSEREYTGRSSASAAAEREIH